MDIFGINIDIANIFSVILKIGLLLLAFIIFIPIGKKIIERTIKKTTENGRSSPGRMKTLEKPLISLFSYVMIFILVVMLFSTIGFEIGPLLAGAGVIGLAVAFGAQGLISDVVTGFFIMLERQLEIDDYVTTAGYDGIVEEIGLRTTKIRSFNGTLNFVPNRYIEGVANHSRGNMRALVDIGISYDDNIDERVVGQTENGVQFECRRDMLKRIKEAFDDANIEIPFPHQVNINKDQT